MKTRAVLFLSFLLSTALPAQDGHYAEEHVGGSSDAKTNQRYKQARKVYDAITPEQKKALEQKGLKDFTGDNALLPYPRILSEKEMDTIQRGVGQRGRALQLFLKDHYSGKKEYLEAGFIPRQVVERLLDRHHERDWQGYLRPDNMSFWYGPDVIRGPALPGHPQAVNLRVIEDNKVYLGGMGDLSLARESLLDSVPQYGEILDSPDPSSFYDQLAKDFLERAKAHGGGVPVYIKYIPSQTKDNEGNRIKKLMEDRGIKVVEIDAWSNNSKRFPGLRSDKDGVWLVEKTKAGKIRRTKVSLIVPYMNPNDLNRTHPSNRGKFIMGEAEAALKLSGPKTAKVAKLKKLMQPDKDGRVDLDALEAHLRANWKGQLYLERKNLGLAGVMDHVAAGRVGITNPPGLDFINDKEFYMYVEDVIRHYLHEEPILRNIRTESFGKYGKEGVTLRKDAVEEVFDDLDKWVIKGVDGRGGDAVWVGPKIDKNDKKLIAELKKRITADPGRFIFQEYTPLSTVDGHIVDARLHVQIGPRGRVIAAPVPWGRALPKDGDGKVNISSNGKEITIMVDRKRGRCAAGPHIRGATAALSRIKSR